RKNPNAEWKAAIHAALQNAARSGSPLGDGSKAPVESSNPGWRRLLPMYSETIQTLADQAAAKLEAQKRSLPGHFVRSMLAGMYVGAAIVLIFTVGGALSGESVQFRRLLMGVCFGGALTIVIFAGSELFTGSNLVLTLGVLKRKA